MPNTPAPLDIKIGSLFPVHFKLFAILSFIGAVGLFTMHPIISIVLLLIGIGIFTAQEGVEFDPAKGSYREYESLFFIKRGNYLPFSEVDHLFINSGQVSQRIYTAHTAQSAVFSKLEYRGYVQLYHGTKVLLGRSKQKSRIEEKLQLAASYFNAEIVDHS